MQPYRVCDAAWSEHHGHNNENEEDSQRSRVLEACDNKSRDVGQADRDHSKGDGAQSS